MKPFIITILVSVFFAASHSLAEDKQHLFIMSGQSNMQRLDPEISFKPAVEAEFGKENVTIVHHAVGGQPIRRWYKKWKPAEGNEMPTGGIGDLYDKVMKKVEDVSQGKKFATVTFLWMQGERDAKEKNGTVYQESFLGLIKQLEKDLGRDDVFVVLGRLSDFDMENEKYPHWTMVREVIVNIAESDPAKAWVDTDDLNEGFNRGGKQIKNDLHYSVEGYKVFGERLAKESIQLIKSKKD